MKGVKQSKEKGDWGKKLALIERMKEKKSKKKGVEIWMGGAFFRGRRVG